MKFKFFQIIILLFILFITGHNYAISGASNRDFTLYETDNPLPLGDPIFYFFDLRDRESFVQVTNMDSGNVTLHVQIFDVSNNCNENNFFDVYTPNDTHVYEMRNILTNDSNPSGVILPDGAYGFVSILPPDTFTPIFGNMRILDENGYEYRTNAVGVFSTIGTNITEVEFYYSFNFNLEEGVTFSDVVGITVSGVFNEDEITVNVTEDFNSFDIDIIDNNETLFSCRDIVFGCTDQNNPLLEQLLEESGANVASFEYGINETIPHSKGGEVLCPGNVIGEGHVKLVPEPNNNSGSQDAFIGFVGLNNGNERGSFDSLWHENLCDDPIFSFLVCGDSA